MGKHCLSIKLDSNLIYLDIGIYLDIFWVSANGRYKRLYVYSDRIPTSTFLCLYTTKHEPQIITM